MFHPHWDSKKMIAGEAAEETAFPKTEGLSKIPN